MAISTWDDLQNRVLGYVMNTSQEVSTPLLEDLMRAGENRIWGVLRVPEMKSYHSFTYAAGGEDLSSFDSGNLLEVKSLTIDTSATTRRAIAEADEDTVRIWMIENDVDSPRVYTFISEADGSPKLAIAPEPTGKTVYVAYWRKFASLDTAVNTVFTTYPHIWLAALLTEVFLYLSDVSMYQVWEQKLGDFIQLANKQGRGLTQNAWNGPLGPHHSRTGRP